MGNKYMTGQIHLSKNKGIPEILFGNIDKINVLNIHIIEPKIRAILGSCDGSFAINLSNIRFIDSQGFSMILNLIKEAKASEKNIFFTNIDPELGELIQMLGISDSMLNIEEYI